ncbi:uncharacterized protein LOC118766888 [Octopus sinensis]|uniref:Uncharacterized protein LOC118766888 n=1 Tax=Octopus sinensis TaxID=2607531 RepID=A0A7E6FFU3_9MOLL|nr:uncharacterized protein LOC118766888 [Octopus sinensis]
MPWPLMRKHALRFRHLWLLLNGEQVWSPFVKWMFPRFTSFSGQESWFFRRSRLGIWFTECRKALLQFHHSGNASGFGTTTFFYSRLVEAGNNDTLGLGDNQLDSLFRRTFGPGCLDNFPKSLAWQCYRGALPIRDKLARHGQTTTADCPRCGRDRKLSCMLLFSVLECLKCGLMQNMSGLGRVQLSSESIVKIDLPDFLTKESNQCFLAVVAIAKEVVWKSRMKGLATGNLISGLGLVRYFIFHFKRKLRLERRCHSKKMFKERRLHVARVLGMKDSS